MLYEHNGAADRDDSGYTANRAYFAPVDRATGTPAIFDPGKHGAFSLDAPPAPWLDLGWIDNFQRLCGSFSPESLTLQPADGLVNDLTVFGVIEPQAYVKDYFVGDNLSLKFYLSQIPFTRRNRTLVDEEYAGTSLDPTRWSVDDPLGVVSVNGGKLQ